MSVPVLLPARFYEFRFLRAPSWLIFRTVLTLLQIYFYKSFPAIFPFAYIVNAGIYSVFHLIYLQSLYVNKHLRRVCLPRQHIRAADFIQQKNTFAVI